MIRKLQFGSGTEIPEFQAFKHSAPTWHGVPIMTAMKVARVKTAPLDIIETTLCRIFLFQLAVERLGHGLALGPVLQGNVEGELLPTLFTAGVLKPERSQPILTGGSPSGRRDAESPCPFKCT